MSLKMEFEQHNRVTLAVVDLEEGSVCLRLTGETPDEAPTDRVMTAYEARALAAMLRHYAIEAERCRA